MEISCPRTIFEAVFDMQILLPFLLRPWDPLMRISAWTSYNFRCSPKFAGILVIAIFYTTTVGHLCTLEAAVSRFHLIIHHQHSNSRVFDLAGLTQIDTVDYQGLH